MRSAFHRVVVMWIALVLTALAVTPPLVAGCTGSQRTKTLRASFIAVDTAADTLVAWSDRCQNSIVDRAASEEEATTKVTAFRAARAQLAPLFKAAYRSIAFAGTDSEDATFTKAIGDADALAKGIASIKETFKCPG